MALPMPRLPECSIAQTRFSSSRHTSMKWLPPPSVPSWCTQLDFLPMRLPMPPCLPRIFCSGFWNALAACERASRSPCCPNPTGTSRVTWPKTFFNDDSSSSLAVSEVRVAIMPQPMSTPTAAGMMALLVGITEPTVAPIPRCTSGIAATWWCTIGRREMLTSCWRAAASISAV